ncbi:MAG: copper resistance protein B [Proteobacteria bacterium]|nr:copper resistance protein B [Pseudomonadota bacterium]
MKILLATAAAIAMASPAAAQMDMNMPGMSMPAKPAAKPPAKAKPKAKPAAAKPKAKPAKRPAKAKPVRKPTTPRHQAAPGGPHPASHDMSAMPGMDMSQPEAAPAAQPNPAASAPDGDMQSMPGMDMAKPDAGAEPAPQTGDDMSVMPGMEPADSPIGSAPAPAPPEDHAADAIFDPAVMARSREALRRENGAFSGSMVLFDLAEYQARKGRDGYRWESDAWFGGDINRLQIKTEGEGRFGKPIEDVEVQALYSRAISPFWNAQIGVRHDIVPNSSRTYAVVGVEGIAPYWFHATGQLFLSDKGDVRGRLEGSYDERITQRLILQPRVELNFSAQDMPAIGVGSGLSSFELGARVRYEIRKEFAPYVGVEWSGKTGDSARYARLAGDKPNTVQFVAGVRFWF